MAPRPSGYLASVGPVVVTVDGWELTASRHRGIGTYLWEVLAGLPQAGDLHVQALAVDGCGMPPGVEAVPIQRRVPRRFQAQLHRARVSADLRRAGGDVAHALCSIDTRGSTQA